ncbi:hypothetical protein AN1V17_29820 [Vallitalea sediminicola]
MMYHIIEAYFLNQNPHKLIIVNKWYINNDFHYKSFYSFISFLIEDTNKK